MPFPNPSTQFNSESGRTAGQKSSRKGKKNWSTLVQEMLEDEEATIKMLDPKTKQEVELKYPAKVIAETMMKKAMAGDTAAAKWLRETGYGNKLTVSTDPEEELKRKRYEDFLNGGDNLIQDDGEDAEAGSDRDLPESS